MHAIHEIKDCCYEYINENDLVQWIEAINLKNNMDKGFEFREAMQEPGESSLHNLCHKFPLMDILNEYIVNPDEIRKNNIKMEKEGDRILAEACIACKPCRETWFMNAEDKQQYCDQCAELSGHYCSDHEDLFFDDEIEWAVSQFI